MDEKAALNRYLEAIKADYADWQKVRNVPLTDLELQLRAKMEKEFNEGLRITEGQQYFKVISGSGVHSFIVKEDGVKFKRGDILKAASWNAPAKNRARGNIYDQYRILWTGTGYLR